MKYNYFEILTGKMFEINSLIDFFPVKILKDVDLVGYVYRLQDTVAFMWTVGQ